MKATITYTRTFVAIVELPPSSTGDPLPVRHRALALAIQLPGFLKSLFWVEKVDRGPNCHYGKHRPYTVAIENDSKDVTAPVVALPVEEQEE